MTKIILSGCNGRMGHVVTELSAQDPEAQIVAGVDVFGEGSGQYPVFQTYAEIGADVEADVMIDFSLPAAFDSMLDFAIARKLPVIVCTTGLSDEQLKRLDQASKEIAVLRSANMSLGINLLLKLVKEAAATLTKAGFDIEIVEHHHNQKKDAPSGTALALADSMNGELGGDYTYVYDRTSRSQKRDPKEIGISSVRGGTIPGIHEVIYAGPDEIVEIKHTAYSRSIFAQGALSAAKFLAGESSGFYTMADVVGV